LRSGEIWNTAMWVTISWLPLAGTESITWSFAWVPSLHSLGAVGNPNLIANIRNPGEGLAHSVVALVLLRVGDTQVNLTNLI